MKASDWKNILEMDLFDLSGASGLIGMLRGKKTEEYEEDALHILNRLYFLSSLCECSLISCCVSWINSMARLGGGVDAISDAPSIKEPLEAFLDGTDELFLATVMLLADLALPWLRFSQQKWAFEAVHRKEVIDKVVCMLKTDYRPAALALINMTQHGMPLSTVLAVSHLRVRACESNNLRIRRHFAAYR